MGKLHKIRRAFWKEVEKAGYSPMPLYTSVSIDGNSRRGVQSRVGFGNWYWHSKSYQGLLKSLYREYRDIVTNR